MAAAQNAVAPLPADQELPEAMNVEGAQLEPQVGFFIAHNNLIRIVILFVVVAIGYGFWELGVLIAKKAHPHHHQDPLKCQQKVMVELKGGQYSSVSEALEHAPDLSTGRFCIFIKSGIYREGIVIGSTKTNIVLIGEGKNKTIITASGIKNNSATAEVRGNGFIALNLTFANTGMAVNSSADETVFYNCKITGGHLTLQADRKRQFFRDCEIYGSNSIVTGDGSVYFQNCHIYVAETNTKPQVITSQGGGDSWSDTGFVFDRCSIEPIPGNRTLIGSNQAYLGCPGGDYSRVLVIRSFLSGSIRRKGWTYCNGYRPQHLLFGEYMNTGPGADTEGRVRWNGVKVLKPSEATEFALQSFFLEDTDWFSSLGIPYWLN